MSTSIGWTRGYAANLSDIMAGSAILKRMREMEREPEVIQDPPTTIRIIDPTNGDDGYADAEMINDTATDKSEQDLPIQLLYEFSIQGCKVSATLEIDASSPFHEELVSAATGDEINIDNTVFIVTEHVGRQLQLDSDLLRNKNGTPTKSIPRVMHEFKSLAKNDWLVEGMADLRTKLLAQFNKARR